VAFGLDDLGEADAPTMARTGSAGTTASSRNTTTQRPRRIPTSEASLVRANRAMTALSLLQGRQLSAHG
jgi:hypothetical protein